MAKPNDARCSRAKGFTLIELLVVIAIIAILAALLLPVFASAKMQSQSAACQSNLKQLAAATHIYDSDFQGYFPNYYYDASLNWGTAGWMEVVIAYAGAQGKVRLCAAASETNGGMPPAAQGPGTANNAWWCPLPTTFATLTMTGSFGFNGWLYNSDVSQITSITTVNNPSTVESYMFYKESNLVKPSMTPVEFDEEYVDEWPIETDEPTPNLYTENGYSNPAAMERCIIPRHGGFNPVNAPTSFNIANRLPGAINIGFTDGHVETVPLENLWQCYWHNGWVTPSKRPGT